MVGLKCSVRAVINMNHAGPAAESFFLLALASCVAQMLVGGLWMLANRS